MGKNVQEMIFRVDIELCQYGSWALANQRSEFANAM
jgi:hypothetical protein